LQNKEKDLIKTIKQKEKEATKLQQSIKAIIADEIKKASVNSVNKPNNTKTNGKFFRYFKRTWIIRCRFGSFK